MSCSKVLVIPVITCWVLDRLGGQMLRCTCRFGDVNVGFQQICMMDRVLRTTV